MADIVHGVASWPGVESVVGCSYTASHGISPGVATLRFNPQATVPAMRGTLVITDGVNGSITLPDCKVERMTQSMGSRGTEWTLEIMDRRWKWRDLGFISGCYNQLDPYGKLIPWTIRSPTELAVLCLQAMGETNYQIDLPPGLNYPGPEITAPIPNVSGVNPPVDWNAIPPGQALDQLANSYGRRVVYSTDIEGVLIARPGIGRDIPGGSISQFTPSLDVPATPAGVAVVGAPTRYQMRLLLDAVGEEWNGHYRPIEALSYAPVQAAAKHKVTFTPTNVRSGYNFRVTINGQEFSTPNGSAAAICAALAAAINTALGSVVTATASSTALTVEGKVAGVGFSYKSSVAPNTGDEPRPTMPSALVTQARKAGKSWALAHPPLFPGVVETDRLTKAQAVALAQKSVWKCYRVADVDASGAGAINVPGLGEIVRRQQLIIEPTQVEQITPEAVDSSFTDRLGRPLVVNYYNGYSRDKPSAVYGSVARYLVNALAKGAVRDANTLPTDQVFVDFATDPVQQLITFSNYVYKVGKSQEIVEPVLHLQAAVTVRDSGNNQVIPYISAEALPGGNTDTNVAAMYRPDVQLNVIGDYNAANVVVNVRLLEADAIDRASYYRAGMKLQYLLAESKTANYNGIRYWALDGAIQQATYEVGEDGAKTTISRNGEHGVYIPPYPARRRAEFLAPAAQDRIRAKVEPGRLSSPGEGSK